MTPNRNESRDLSPAGAFDKLLIVLAILGAAVAALAAVVAFRGGAATAAEDGGGVGEPQVVSLSLSEFAIDGPVEIAAGPTRLEVGNEGSVIHNLALEGGPVHPRPQRG